MRRVAALVVVLLLAFLVWRLFASRDDAPTVEPANEGGAAEFAPAVLGAPPLATAPAAPSTSPGSGSIGAEEAARTPTADVEGRSLAVRVVKQGGTPVEGARAFIEDTDSVASGATTDDQGRAVLKTEAENGWVLVRSASGVWGRDRFGPQTEEVLVVLSDVLTARGIVLDPWRRPVDGLTSFSIVGLGGENPARRWPGVRRWELRSEATEVAVQPNGSFEIRGLESEELTLPRTSRGLVLRTSDGVEAFVGRGGRPDLVAVAPERPGRFLLREASTGRPVFGGIVELDDDWPPTALRVDVDADLVTVEWGKPPRDETRVPRAWVRAPGYQKRRLDLESERILHRGGGAFAKSEPRLTNLVPDGKPRAGELRLPTGWGIPSLVPRCLTSLSVHAGGRGTTTTGVALNKGENWLVYVGPPGFVSVSEFLVFEPVERVDVPGGESVLWESPKRPWGAVRFRLSADLDLVRGPFQAEARMPGSGSGYRFPLEVGPDGEADGGAWPAGAWTFRLWRSAEEGTSELVVVRASAEPTLVEIPIRNLLTR